MNRFPRFVSWSGKSRNAKSWIVTTSGARVGGTIRLVACTMSTGPAGALDPGQAQAVPRLVEHGARGAETTRRAPEAAMAAAAAHGAVPRRPRRRRRRGPASPRIEAQRGDRSAPRHAVPALLDRERYPQAASAGGITPTIVEEGGGVVVAAASYPLAGAEVTGVVRTAVKSRPRTICTSAGPAGLTGCSSAPDSMTVASVRAAASWPFA